MSPNSKRTGSCAAPHGFAEGDRSTKTPVALTRFNETADQTSGQGTIWCCHQCSWKSEFSSSSSSPSSLETYSNADIQTPWIGFFLFMMVRLPLLVRKSWGSGEVGQYIIIIPGLRATLESTSMPPTKLTKSKWKFSSSSTWTQTGNGFGLFGQKLHICLLKAGVNQDAAMLWLMHVSREGSKRHVERHSAYSLSEIPEETASLDQPSHRRHPRLHPPRTKHLVEMCCRTL